MKFPQPTVIAPEEVDRVCGVLEATGWLSAVNLEAATLIRTMYELVAPAKLEVDLTTCIARRRGIQMKFSPNQIAIIYRLVQAYPHYVPMSEIKVAVWGAACADRRPNTNVLQVAMSDSRTKLMALGVRIDAKRNTGYRLQYNGVN